MLGNAPRIVLFYACFACLWILLSDKAVEELFDDRATIALVSTIKGWLFVLVTSLLVLGLIRHLLAKAMATSQVPIEVQERQTRTNKILYDIVNGLPDAVFAKDLDGRYILFNRETARVFGKAAEQALGKDDVATFPAQAELIRANDRQVILENRIHTYEETVTTVDGDRTYLAVKGPLRDDEGKVIGMFGVSRDLTERRTVDQALSQKERYQRALLDNFPFAVWLKDTESRFLAVNAGFVRIFGARDADELIGKTDFDIAPRDMAEGYRADDREVLTSRQKKNVEEEIITEGRRKWFETYKAPVINDDGEVLGTVGFARDITDRKAAADQIEHLAFYDPLTDLPNRRLLLDRLQQALTSSARNDHYGALMLLDVDDFKTLNDTFGHDVGDRFLVEVASRVESGVRAGDTVARQGGDEFVVILEDLSEEALAAIQAEGVAQKILHAIDQPYVLDLNVPDGPQDTRSYHCTGSIGITLFCGMAFSPDELMKRADTAMYQAKAAGGNTLRFFDPEMQAVVNARAVLHNDLRQAVRDDQFVIYYQPQMGDTGHMTGAEALIRWNHPRRGLVSPNDFIAQAESTELILSIGHWVLQAACTQLVLWAARPDMSDIALAVNVSARQFRHRDFVDQLITLLDRTGADPHKLKLELTESLLLEDVEDIIAKMTVLKAKGIGFSLDDFGTGYSSLSYLKRLPLDQLKIDESFVRDVLGDSNDATIAKTIVALARSLGLDVIAEGVESEAQKDFLASLGCHAYQGYLCSPPLPLDAFEEFSRRAI